MNSFGPSFAFRISRSSSTAALASGIVVAPAGLVQADHERARFEVHVGPQLRVRLAAAQAGQAEESVQVGTVARAGADGRRSRLFVACSRAWAIRRSTSVVCECVAALTRRARAGWGRAPTGSSRSDLESAASRRSDGKRSCGCGSSGVRALPRASCRAATRCMSPGRSRARSALTCSSQSRTQRAAWRT